MSARPAAVRIDDLAVPHYSEEVRAILDFMEEAGSQLTLTAPAELMATARAETGLEDFGADDFVGRLEVLCEAILTRREASTAPASCSSTFSCSGC